MLGAALLTACSKGEDKESRYSSRLEGSQGFMKIRLGTSISRYAGFTELPSDPAHVPPGAKTWGYTAKDNKYSKLGEFELRSYGHEKAVTDDLDKYISPAEQAKWPELFLFVYTLNDTICAIKADVSTQVNGQSKIFNYYLEEVYGPTMGSKANPNDIMQNIQTGNTVSWESEHVSLESKIVTVNRYYQGRQLNFDTYNQLLYWWKPALARLNQQKSNDEAAKKGALEEQL